jgi:Zn-dependent protease
MKENVRLGRIAGVAVGFSWSLLLFAGFLAFLLGGGRFPVDAPGYPEGAYVFAGVVTAIAFLAGELAHEISHALVARHEGLKVDGIVLWLMGGYTKISDPPETAGQELRIAGAGPLVSFVLGVALALAALVGHGIGVSRLAISVLEWLGLINVLLAVFNMLPGSPLDGGRIVHAIVWWRTGDKYRATRAATRSGWVLGICMVGFGLALAFSVLGIDGLWLAMVGGFLMVSSRAEGGAAAILEPLEGLTAADVMAQPGVGPGWFTVDAFLRDYAGGGTGALRAPAFLLEQWGGGLAGLAPPEAMEAVPLAQRYQFRASQFAEPMAQLPVFEPEVEAVKAVTQMSGRGANWGLVVAAGQIIGVLSVKDMAAATQRARATAAVDSPGWSLTRG